jgi:hypothetical protein
MLNQKFPLNTWEKITTTRSYYDIDEGGGGDIENPKEQLKRQRQQKAIKDADKSKDA